VDSVMISVYLVNDKIAIASYVMKFLPLVFYPRITCLHSKL